MKREISSEEQHIIEGIRQEDRKKSPLFVLICVLSGLGGGAIGMFGMILVAFVTYYFRDGVSFVEWFARLQRNAGIFALPIMILVGVVLSVLCIVYYNKARKIWYGDGDEDEKYEKADAFLSTVLILSNCMFLSVMMLFGMVFYAALVRIRIEDYHLFSVAGTTVTGLLFYFAFLFIYSKMQHLAVNFSKLIHPEKRGSFFDFKFQKVWFNSCDEAERQQIGYASYITVKMLNFVLLGLMVVLVILGMFVEIGILPLLITGTISLVLNITYGIASKNATGVNSMRV